MRIILLGDIIAAARVLLAMPAEMRVDQLQLMIRQADAAHKYQKRFSIPHPEWGNGSLMARANVEPQTAEPFASDLAYLRALHIALAGIIARKRAAKGR